VFPGIFCKKASLMCGIFGYVGNRTTARLLIDSLARLEYRGYDSWGVCLCGEGGLEVRRQVGRISAAQTTEEAGRGSWGGIAHTRWATHGAPTEANAHPHRDCSGRIAVVHNGIIENHAALRTMLERKGHVFRSETDTEVIPHLVEDLLKSEGNVRQAFADALKVLEGTYAVALMCAELPGALLVARRGSPMLIGVGRNEMMVASDAAALVTHTRRVVYLDDGDTALLRAGDCELRRLDSTPVMKPAQEIAFDLPAIERGGHPHFMHKEIFEQPVTLLNALRGRIERPGATARLDGIDDKTLRRAKRCQILACGTSYHAGLVGKYLLENLARLPTEVSYAAEYRYANPIVDAGTLTIAVSQSGETADTLAAVREAKLRGGAAVSLCNVVGSTIARECGQGVYIHAGPEIGVASTKAFTGQIVMFALLALHMGRMREMSLREGAAFLDALERLPEQARETLALDEQVRAAAEEMAGARSALFIGRLYEYPVALEGALKLKEISYVHAEGLAAAELKHGPIALIDAETPTVALAAQSGVFAKTISNVQEVRARGGDVLAVVRRGDDRLNGLARRTLAIPPTADPLVPVLAVIPLQLLAYHVATLRGCDVDRPRNLAKSVTVE